MHHVRTTVAQDQRLRWSTTVALVAVQKLSLDQALALPEKKALLQLAEDFRSVAKKNDDRQGDVLMMRRMSGNRISGNLRRVMAMNSPKVSALEPATLSRAAFLIDELASGGFSKSSVDVDTLDSIRHACEELLRAI